MQLEDNVEDDFIENKIYKPKPNKTICFLCKSETDYYESYDINNTFTTFTHTLISNFIEKIVRQRIVCIGLICSRCCNLFNELDLAEKKVVDINETLRKYLNCTVVATNNVYCQTDLHLDDRFEICDDTLSVQKPIVKPYECSFCSKKFASKNGAVLHEKRAHSIANESDIKFPLPDAHRVDVKEENSNNLNENDYVICGENVKEDADKEVEIPDYINCNLSDEVKSSVKAKKPRGRKKKFPDVLKPYQCATCSKSWKTLAELKHHMISHNIARPFICEICGQAYKHKSALEIHVGMHKGVNPFTCVFCNKSFTQKVALQRHLPIHTGETPYQCDQCGKRFVHHTSFNIHKLSHTGEKSYKCSICSLRLLSGSHLKRHMRVHTGERNYACPVCNRRFAERYNLVSHQKLHDLQNDPNKPPKRNHRCQACGGCFERKIKLDEHLASCESHLERKIEMDEQSANCEEKRSVDDFSCIVSSDKNQEWISSAIMLKDLT